MSRFSDFMREIEKEAETEGPEAIRDLQRLRDYYRDLRSKAVHNSIKLNNLNS